LSIVCFIITFEVNIIVEL